MFADFEDYLATQDKVSQAFLKKSDWTAKSILNTANSGKFSSDRTVREYASAIWGLEGY